MSTRPRAHLALAAAITLVLGACGGSGSTDSVAAAADSVPPTATASTQSFVDFEKGLEVSDVIEPLTLQQFLPPLDDTSEPTPIG